MTVTDLLNTCNHLFLLFCIFSFHLDHCGALPWFLEKVQELINQLKINKNFILLQEKLLQFDWLTAVVFQLNLKYLHVKITNLLWVVV